MRRAVAVVVAAMMMILPGCGRQVTGLGKTSELVPSGQMEVIFGTQAALDTNDYSYIIVFNTQGNDNEPYALGQNSNYLNWSWVIQIGGSNPGFSGGVSAVSSPRLYQIYSDPSVSVGYAPDIKTYPTGALVLRPYTTGGAFSTGFEVQFNRCLLDQPNPLTSPQPSPNPAIDCPPYAFIQPSWAINIFTVDNTGTVVDSLGNNGPSDTSVQFTVNTAAVVSSYQPKTIITQLSNPAAEISGLQVFSQP